MPPMSQTPTVPAPVLAKSDQNLVWLDCEMTGLDPEVERIIEATQAMGASTLQIIFRALLPEALPGLIAAATVTAITLVSYTAMSGLIGGGGLGDLAVRYGYQRYQPDVMAVTVILLLILVQILQSTGDKLVVHFSRK